MEGTTYHSLLRVSMVVMACVLVFQSGVYLPVTRSLSDQTSQYVANVVGIYAGVEPTELNMLTAELTAKENELQEREAQIVERELAIGITEPNNSARRDMTTYILSGILFILLVLVVLNYALDFAREKRRAEFTNNFAANV